MSPDRKLNVAGFVVGLLSLLSYPWLFAMTPVAPLLIGAVAAISPKTRPFALGAIIAAAVAVAALVVFLVVLSVAPPGADHYGPGYVQ